MIANTMEVRRNRHQPKTVGRRTGGEARRMFELRENMRRRRASAGESSWKWVPGMGCYSAILFCSNGALGGTEV